MTVCIIAVYLPILLYLLLQKKIRQYDIGELSIMICTLTIGITGMLTLLTYYTVNSKWLITVFMLIYFTFYLKVIHGAMLIMMDVVKHSNE